jgi:hypothetical protein
MCRSQQRRIEYVFNGCAVRLVLRRDPIAGTALGGPRLASHGARSPRAAPGKRRSVAFTVPQAMVQATPADETEIARALDLRGVPAAALELVGQAPLKSMYAAGRYLKVTNFAAVHGCLPFSRDTGDESPAEDPGLPVPQRPSKSSTTSS